MDAGLGAEVEGILHLVEGGRNARLLEALIDEHQEFVLLSREHWQIPRPDEV
jgi:hypothetical protein